MTFSVAFVLFFRTIDGLLRYSTVRYGALKNSDKFALPIVFNSRSWLFNRPKTISEAIKECENNWNEPFYKRKLYNIGFDHPHLVNYQINYKTVVYK
jgi:hypothetical protein